MNSSHNSIYETPQRKLDFSGQKFDGSRTPPPNHYSQSHQFFSGVKSSYPKSPAQQNSNINQIRSKYEEIKRKNPNSQSVSPRHGNRSQSDAMSIRSDFSNNITPVKKFHLNETTTPVVEKFPKMTKPQPIIKIDKNNAIPKTYDGYAQKYQQRISTQASSKRSSQVTDCTGGSQTIIPNLVCDNCFNRRLINLKTEKEQNKKIQEHQKEQKILQNQKILEQQEQERRIKTEQSNKKQFDDFYHQLLVDKTNKKLQNEIDRKKFAESLVLDQINEQKFRVDILDFFNFQDQLYQSQVQFKQQINDDLKQQMDEKQRLKEIEKQRNNQNYGLPQYWTFIERSQDVRSRKLEEQKQKLQESRQYETEIKKKQEQERESSKKKDEQMMIQQIQNEKKRQEEIKKWKQNEQNELKKELKNQMKFKEEKNQVHLQLQIICKRSKQADQLMHQQMTDFIQKKNYEDNERLRQKQQEQSRDYLSQLEKQIDYKTQMKQHQKHREVEQERINEELAKQQKKVHKNPCADCKNKYPTIKLSKFDM